MTDQIITDIRKNIAWLEEHKKSNSVVSISKVVAELQVQAMTLSDEVSSAYALMNESEDAYKHAYENYKANFEGSVAKAESKAAVKFQDLKKTWTSAKNVYKRLDTILERIDKICDAQRQKISVITKTDLKNV